MDEMTKHNILMLAGIAQSERAEASHYDWYVGRGLPTDQRHTMTDADRMLTALAAFQPTGMDEVRFNGLVVVWTYAERASAEAYGAAGMLDKIHQPALAADMRKNGYELSEMAARSRGEVERMVLHFGR